MSGPNKKSKKKGVQKQSNKSHYASLIHKISSAPNFDELILSELRLICISLALIIASGSLAHLFIAHHWQMPTVDRTTFFIVLNLTALSLLMIPKATFSINTKLHCTGFIMALTIFISFFFYYQFIGSIFWYITVITIFFSSIISSSIIFYYFSVSYFTTYLFSLLLYELPHSDFDIAYQVALFCLLTFVWVAAYIAKSQYNSIMKSKMSAYNNLMEQNEEINALYEEITASQSTLMEQNDQLNQYINEVTSQRERLEFLSSNDLLTGLPNRKMTLEHLQLLIDMNQDQGNAPSFAVVFIDLDHFKKVNDSFGHKVGDALLLSLSDRLLEKIHKRDFLSRLSSDEFVLVISRTISEEQLFTFITNIAKIFEEPFVLSENATVRITASFGIALWPQDADTAYDILQSADTAMYKAKERGRNNIQFYHKTMQEEVLSKIDLENRLIEAITEDQLYLKYQPIFETKTKELVGFEALLRWTTKEGLSISPGEFIPLAEETGLIHEIGKQVIEKACRKIKHIQDRYKKPFRIGINLSAVQIKDPDLVNKIKKMILQEEISPHYFTIEITESVFIQNKQEAVNIFRELMDFGIHVVMDDFGTGYSSLSYLMDLPLNKIKIDKSFIDVIGYDHRKAEVLRSIIQMIHSMDMEVVAEGVETLDQVNFLERNHCDLLQGYFLGYPLDESDMEALLRQFTD